MPKVVFIEPSGARRELSATAGRNLMDIAREAGLDIEGACDGAMACSTCHLIVDAAWIGRLPPKNDDEQDMLDLALGVTKNSRLGCQIVLNEALDGLVVALPRQTRNMLGG
ncbi:MAG: 2Fe-2S iron-sulfur cluster binding domain-containing protein [Alphaproteobacteria bacterium]|nr:2Fe-2S iron-sulfur cluster binding domain-containing protein [Alphaproteobacteria bacterium]